MDFKVEVSKILSEKISDFSYEEILSMIEIPPNAAMGDFAFPCFKLAKTYRKSPNIIAQELAQELNRPSYLKSIEFGEFFQSVFLI